MLFVFRFLTWNDSASALTSLFALSAQNKIPIEERNTYTEHLLRQIRKTTIHPLEVAKKYVETYSSSDAAAQDPEAGKRKTK